MSGQYSTTLPMSSVINITNFSGEDDMTAIAEINGTLNEIADHIGDLYEQDAVMAQDIADLQTELAAIDLTDIIDDSADSTATAVTYSANKISSLLATMQTEMVNGAPANMGTFGEVATEVGALQSRVTILETKVANLDNKFDTAGKIKSEFLPSFVTGGLTYQGTFSPAVDTLDPALEGEGGNDGHFYTVSANGVVTTATGATPVSAGDTLISDGNAWVAIAREDAVTTVNGKTGNVVLTGADINFVATLESGLSATEMQAGLNEVATKMKTFTDAFGDPADMLGLSDFQARLLTARTDGVQTAP